MRKKLYRNLLASALLLSSCGHLTIKNREVCSVAGRIQFGGICAETLTDKTRDLTYTELTQMLEAQPERPDPVGTPGQTHKCGEVETDLPCLPAHGAAIILTTDDFNGFKTDLETACRMLGNKCSYEVQQSIKAAFERLESAIKNMDRRRELLRVQNTH